MKTFLIILGALIVVAIIVVVVIVWRNLDEINEDTYWDETSGD